MKELAEALAKTFEPPKPPKFTVDELIMLLRITPKENTVLLEKLATLLIYAVQEACESQNIELTPRQRAIVNLLKENGKKFS